MIKNEIASLLLLAFLGACAPESKEYVFEDTIKSEIDESRTVLSSFPRSLTEINDSLVAVVNSARTLSVYNVYTGKNTAEFSPKNISFDSLVKATYQKKYKGRRNYVYDTLTAGGISDGNCQMHKIYYKDHNYYVYVNAVMEVKFINDPEELKKYTENEKYKALKKQTKDVGIRVLNFVEFIFVLNDQLKLKKIIPLYENSNLKADEYAAFYQLGFAVKDNRLFTPILNQTEASQLMTDKLKPGKAAAIAIFDPQSEDEPEYRLTSKELNFGEHTLRDYFLSPFQFKEDEGELIVTNGKEISAIESGKKLFSKYELLGNEWIDDYWKSGENILMLTHTNHKKINPTEIELAYAVDSSANYKIRIFNCEKKWVGDKTLPKGISLPFLITANKVVYMSKDKEHYYFNVLNYNEK